MRISQLLLLLFFTGIGFSQKTKSIVLTDSSLGESFGGSVYVFEDVKNQCNSIDEALKIDLNAFQTQEEDILSFDFTSATYWLRFTITNKTEKSDFLFQTGREVTNEVRFFELDSLGNVVNALLSGDDFAYSEKLIEHRKHLFPFVLQPNQTKTFYVKLRSDGEMLFAPVRVHDPTDFYAQDFKDQFQNGFYYGVIVLTVIIYFFFFIYLSDRTFLYYILYVFCQGILQFSLDGYSHHHFFPGGGYFTNRILSLFSSLTVVFSMIYFCNFLNLKKQSPKLNNVFRVSMFCMLVIGFSAFTTGTIYEYSFLFVNGGSFLSILLAAFTIIYLIVKGGKIDVFFATAYLILLMGAIIFILGNLGVVGDKEFSLAVLKICSALEFAVLSISMSSKYGKLQREKESAQKNALQSLKEKNELMDRSNVQLENQVKERTKEIERQKEELTISNDSIISSIKYAKRIQQAILPSDEHIQKLLPNSCVFYRPKDVVSGDFYFVETTRTSDKDEAFTIFSVVDCTGHGVPGAFMSIVGNNFLTQSLSESDVNSPAAALDYLNRGVSKTLKQSSVNGAAVRDGMDIVLCALSNSKDKLMFAAAKNPLYIMRSKEIDHPNTLMEDQNLRLENEKAMLFEVKGDKFPIGNLTGATLAPFTNHELAIHKGDHIVIFTDGFADQFGGERHKKFNYKRFRELLLEGYGLSIQEQYKRLANAFDLWKGDVEQIDDVLVMIVKI